MDIKKLAILVLIFIGTSIICVAQSPENINYDLSKSGGIFAFTDNDTRFTWFVSNDFYFCAYNWEEIDLWELINEVIPSDNNAAVFNDQSGYDYHRMIWSFLREQDEFNTVFYIGWYSQEAPNIHFLEVDKTKPGSPGVGYGFRLLGE